MSLPACFEIQYLLTGISGGRGSKRRKFYNRTATAKGFTYATSLYRLDSGTPLGYDQSVEILVNYSEGNNRSATRDERSELWGKWRQPQFETW